MANATDNQMDYIKDLLRKKSNGHTIKAADAIRGIPDISNPDFRHDVARHNAHLLLARVYGAIVVPEALEQKRASYWIESLKNSSMLDTALDNPKAAAALGIADLIDAERDAIERAQKEAF